MNEMNERKRDICYKLFEVLKRTSRLHDLVDLEYYRLGNLKRSTCRLTVISL